MAKRNPHPRPKPTIPARAKKALEQLYRIESLMESLRTERAEIVRTLDAELFPVLHDRLCWEFTPQKLARKKSVSASRKPRRRR